MSHAYVCLHCDRGPYTVSALGWSTLLHGVYPAKHGITSNDISNLNYGRYHDLFYYMRQNNPEYSLATISNWDNFLQLTSNEDYAQAVSTDMDVKNKTIDLLLTTVPDITLLHFNDVDHYGHKSGFSPNNPEYINAIKQTGIYTDEIMQLIKMREKNFGEEWMVIVVTDHGGEGTSHGNQDNIEATRFVFSIVRLPNINRIDIPNSSNVDIMPAILKYMNIPIDPNWNLDGTPIF